MTAYEMRISDWSSDVCSSDLREPLHRIRRGAGSCAADRDALRIVRSTRPCARLALDRRCTHRHRNPAVDLAIGAPDGLDRKRVVLGKSVSVRVDLGGVSIFHKTLNI